MALETLNGVKKIDGFDVIVMDKLREKYPEKFNESGAMDYAWFEKDIRPKNFIYVRQDKNSLAFTIQNGPVGENGVNGCQVDTVIKTAQVMLEGLNSQFPSHYNAAAISALQFAYNLMKSRKLEREGGGV